MQAVEEKPEQQDGPGYAAFRLPPEPDDRHPLEMQLEWKWIPEEVVVLVQRDTAKRQDVVNYTDGTVERVVLAVHLPSYELAMIFVGITAIEIVRAVREANRSE